MRNTLAPEVKDTSSNLVKIGRALLINHPKGRQAKVLTEPAKEKPLITMSDSQGRHKNAEAFRWLRVSPRTQLEAKIPLKIQILKAIQINTLIVEELAQR